MNVPRPYSVQQAVTLSNGKLYWSDVPGNCTSLETAISKAKQCIAWRSAHYKTKVIARIRHTINGVVWESEK